MVTLNATFNLQYPGFTGGAVLGRVEIPSAPRIDQMLPNESTTGGYIFEGVKDGVDPLELVFDLSSGGIRCGSAGYVRDPADAKVPRQNRIDIRDMPLESQN
jgi:hypothetical protein